ncbi:MAG: hypothetical protein IPI66_10435 [Chitinophagaceae bacterium]|nr:hypothetical protein [Chitinophagaceae bacterium]
MRTIAIFLVFISFLNVSKPNTVITLRPKAGLSLRDQPGVNGKVLDKIPYGERW